MKTIFLLFVLFVLQLSTYAQVGRTSFYFVGSSNELTEKSKENLKSLKLIIDTMHFQLIEVNSFSDFETSYAANMEVARKRVDFIYGEMNADRAEGSVNILGKKRDKVDFVPLNWNRIDVYYFVKEKPIVKPAPKIEEKKPVKKWGEIPKKKTKKPEIVPIRFVEGTANIQPKSVEYLDRLYDVLQKYPELNIHIRGHVCCYNNIRASKKRAKVVYKYLVKKGISKKRMTYAGYGNTLPLYFPEKYKSDREANRRVDVLFDKEIPITDGDQN